MEGGDSSDGRDGRVDWGEGGRINEDAIDG